MSQLNSSENPFASGAVPTLSLAAFPSAEEMEKMDLPNKDYWIRPIVPKRSKCQLSGLPKYGKSHLVELMGLCLAEGLSFLGLPTDKARVLYLEFDSTDTDLKERIELKKQYLDVKGSNLHYRVYPIPLCLDIKNNEPGFDGINNLRQILDSFKSSGKPIDVVILDPRIKLMKGNANDVYATWTSNVSNLIRGYSVSVIIVHHEGKYDYSELEKKGLDSIKYNAWFDVLMSLKSKKDDDGKISSGVLEYTGKIPESGKFNLTFDNATTIWHLSEVDEEKHLTKKQKAKEIILKKAGEQGGCLEEEIKQASMTAGAGHTTFHMAMKELLAEGKVISIPIDKNKRKIALPQSS